MKTNYFLITMLLLLSMTSCSTYYRMTSRVERDGSMYREIYAQGDSAFIAGDKTHNPFLFQPNANWQLVNLDSTIKFNFWGEEEKLNVKACQKLSGVDGEYFTVDKGKEHLHGVSEQQHHADGHNGLTVGIAAKTVGDHITDAPGSHCSQHRRSFKIAFKTDGGPGDQSGESRWQHRTEKDLHTACAHGLKGLQSFLGHFLETLGKGTGKKGCTENTDADDAGVRAEPNADQHQKHPDDGGNGP